VVQSIIPFDASNLTTSGSPKCSPNTLYQSSEPLRGAKTDQRQRGFAGLKKTKKFCRRSGASGRWGGDYACPQTTSPPPKTKLKKFGGWGRNRDQLILFISFLRSTAGSRLVIGCRLDLRKTKKPANGGFFGSKGGGTPQLRGNRLGGRATEITSTV
jgi:hypothetical protein